MRNSEAAAQELSAEAEAELMRSIAGLRRNLKQLSKNQLIALLIQQVTAVAEHQNINKILLEKIQTLEAAQGGTDAQPTT